MLVLPCSGNKQLLPFTACPAPTARPGGRRGLELCGRRRVWAPRRLREWACPNAGLKGSRCLRSLAKWPHRGIGPQAGAGKPKAGFPPGERKAGVRENACQVKRAAGAKAGSLERPSVLVWERTSQWPRGRAASRSQDAEMPPRADETEEPVRNEGPIALASGFQSWVFRPHVTPKPWGPRWAPERDGGGGGGRLAKGGSHAPGPPSAWTILLSTVYM